MPELLLVFHAGGSRSDPVQVVMGELSRALYESFIKMSRLGAGAAHVPFHQCCWWGRWSWLCGGEGETKEISKSFVFKSQQLAASQASLCVISILCKVHGVSCSFSSSENCRFCDRRCNLQILFCPEHTCWKFIQDSLPDNKSTV